MQQPKTKAVKEYHITWLQTYQTHIMQKKVQGEDTFTFTEHPS